MMPQHSPKIPTFLRETLQHNKAYVSILIMFSAFSSLAEAAGLMCLFPILQYIENGGERVADSRLWDSMERLHGWFGLEVTIYSLCLIALALHYVSSQLVYQRLCFRAAFRARISFSIRKQVIDQLFCEPITVYERLGSSTVINILLQESVRVSMIFFSMTSILSQLILFVCIAGFCTYLSWKMTAMILICLAVIFLAMRRKTQEARELGNSLSDENQQLSELITDFTTQYKLLRINGFDVAFVERLKQTTESLAHVDRDIQKIAANVQMKSRVLLHFMVLAAVCVSTGILNLGLAEMAMLIALAGRMGPLFNESMVSWSNLSANWPSVYSVARVLHEDKNQAATPSSSPVSLADHSYTLRNVTYRYENTDNADSVFSELNISIPSAKTTVIMGPSGTGKSTLLDLLSGIRTAEKGNVLIDNIPVGNIPRTQLTELIAYVPQKTGLTKDSIRNTLAFGHPQITDDDIMKVCQSVGLHEHISNLPQGYDTVLGDGHTGLSGGQTQRLIVAQMLLKNPRVVLMDEPSSALDEAAQKQLIELLREQQSVHQYTLIIATHAPAFRDIADALVELTSGGNVLVTSRPNS